ncbi:LysE family translocator [Micromonospora olivasterospora]|uniref:LysE type translocator n=1 Tax=Micromonospora olivasterospora TaxID=1880 RepID=A0A562I247_MICOL|nr:LysE family transporter [Micromonospora olivasterospora]TWH65111.1 LysE type translocator [Micromonospora olivasterospora]
MTNPKVLVFYLSVLPQFVAARQPVLPQLSVLVLTHVLVGLGWVAVVVLLLERTRAVLRRPGVRRWLEAGVGVVFLALAARLLLVPG